MLAKLYLILLLNHLLMCDMPHVYNSMRLNMMALCEWGYISSFNQSLISVWKMTLTSPLSCRACTLLTICYGLLWQTGTEGMHFHFSWEPTVQCELPISDDLNNVTLRLLAYLKQNIQKLFSLPKLNQSMVDIGHLHPLQGTHWFLP